MSQYFTVSGQVLVANTGMFTQILKKVLNFLVAKSGYQQPKSGSSNKFHVAWGYRATTRSYTAREEALGFHLF